MKKINVWRINATIFQNIRNIKQFTLNSIIRELIRKTSCWDSYHGGTQARFCDCIICPDPQMNSVKECSLLKTIRTMLGSVVYRPT